MKNLYIFVQQIFFMYETSIDIYSFGVIFLKFHLPFFKTNCERMIKMFMERMKTSEWKMKKESWNRIFRWLFEP